MQERLVREESMKTHQDLYIGLGANSPDTFFTELAERTVATWSRDRAREQDSRQFGESMYLFVRQADAALPGALVAVAKAEEGRWYVTNVVPTESGELAYDEYNGILNEFCHQLVRPVADELGVSVELTKPQLEPEDIMSAEAARLLRRFSASANKSTRGSHPSDQERWMHFLVVTHRDGSEPDADVLRRFLIEDGWSEDAAAHLASEYEFARELLNTYIRGEQLR